MRRLVAATGVVAGLAAAGTALQRRAAARDAERFPAPGRMVDVDGVRLHLCERGSGSPTVILDGGLGTAVSWEATVRALAGFTRVVTYDRAGIGYSDSSPAPRTTVRMTAELRGLLERGGIGGPFVVVGASGAANTARMFACLYPGDTAGVVLVDPVNDTPVPDDLTGLSPATRFQIRVMEGTAPPVVRPAFGVVAAVTSTGLVRAAMALDALPSAFSGPIDRIPEDVRPVFQVQNADPRAWRTRGEEIARLPASFAELREVQRTRPFPDVPLVVISAGYPGFGPPGALKGDALRAMREWRRLSSETLVALSSRGEHVWAEASNHGVIFYEPELVADAARRIVDSVRAGA